MKGNVTHGHSFKGKITSTYRCWAGLKSRCTDKNNFRYSDYGGRGITFDPRWAKFENFLSDMGERPGSLTLDRIDNDGPYCKENCRWVDMITQRRNSRRIKKIEIDGVVHCMKDWAEKLNLDYRIFRYKLYYGISLEEAIKSSRLPGHPKLEP